MILVLEKGAGRKDMDSIFKKLQVVKGVDTKNIVVQLNGKKIH